MPKRILRLEKEISEVETDISRKYLRFEESLKRLASQGYDHHIRPDEAFALAIAHLRKKLTNPDLDNAVEDMLTSGCSEWLSMAFERRGDTLICYTDPQNIMYGKDCYVVGDGLFLKYKHKEEFSIRGLSDGLSWVELGKFSDKLVKHLYSAKFSELPKQMQEASIYLPEDGMLWPVARHHSRRYPSEMFDIGIFQSLAASRGIKMVHPE